VIISACLRAGFQPDSVQQSPQISSAINMVAAGFGITIIPDSLRSIQLPGVSFHQIEDAALSSDIALAWRRWDRSPAVHHLAESLSG